jgi:hypothetical protein
VNAVTPEVRAAATQLAGVALARVRDPATGGVRVEDYLTALASMTGEAALVSAGVLDIEASQMPPGSPVFGDPINVVLSGDTLELAEVPRESVVGLLVGELVPVVVPLEWFGSLEALYRHVAASVGAAPWGAISTTVPADHRPTVLPLQVAFELRPAVDAAMMRTALPASLRHVPCSLALADGLKQVRQAIDLQIALTLSLEVVFGTAKMAPMSDAAFRRAAG